MEQTPEKEQISPTATGNWKPVLLNTVYILLALFTFLFTLDLMIASLQHLGRDAAEVIILATSNPFTGLFIGLLVTAIIQSSSATTSMTVALVASGAITLEGAIPILMGANVGTTITSTIVSLGFITKKKEFRRAVTIGTFHDFFNVLTVLILFPLEYYFGFLSGIAQYLASSFFNEPIGMAQKQFNLLGDRFGFIINHIVNTIDNGFILAIVSIALLFSSILFFRKVLSRTLGFGSQERFQQFFFKSPLKSFGWGLLTTAAIRSSTVTTSLVVPLVAKKVVKIKTAFPFVLGANIGTTITAFIAALFNSNAAIGIAIAHFLFNLIGVLIFFPIPYVSQIPVKLANELGRITLKYRLAGFLYVLLMFFFIPFSLIYLNKDSVSVRELTYQQENYSTGEKKSFTIINKTFLNQPITSWVQYEPNKSIEVDPLKIHTTYRRKNLFLLNNELFELNKPGFCRDDEDVHGKFKTCIIEILPVLKLTTNLSFDSVYVFERTWYQPDQVDSTTLKIYISGKQNVMTKRERVSARGELISKEELYQLREK